MDKLTFIAEIIRALAWPGAVVILILILRKPLGGLIPLLQRLKYKEFELEFGRKIEEAKAEAATELPPAAIEEEPPSAAQTRVLELAEISPRAAVLEAWRSIDSLVVDLAKSHLSAEQQPVRRILPMQAISTLRKKGVIDHGTAMLLRDLRGLRNQAAHAPEFALSTDSALEYAALAERVAQQLKSVGGGVD